VNGKNVVIDNALGLLLSKNFFGFSTNSLRIFLTLIIALMQRIDIANIRINTTKLYKLNIAERVIKRTKP